MANNRTILHLSDDALAAIDRNAPSPHKRGDWVSWAICEVDRLLSDQAEPHDRIDRIDYKLSRLELALKQIINQYRNRVYQQDRELKPQ